MIRDPEIAALRAELEEVGVVVAPHRDHLCVRLPLFAAVRVRLDADGRLACQPMFGPLPRTPAMLASTGSLTVATAALFYVTGASPVALLAAFLSIMSGIGSAWRLVLTESCITRIQLLWSARRHERRAPALPSPAPPFLRSVEAAAPDLTSATRSTERN